MDFGTEPTSKALLGEVINFLIDQKLKDINKKLDEVLSPYQTSHLFKYSQYFADIIQKARGKCKEAEVARRSREVLDDKENATMDSVRATKEKCLNLLSAITLISEVDMDRYTY